jgi:hypothetical protein
MERPMTRTHDLVLVWTLKNRAWIDRCHQFFAGMEALWRRAEVTEPGALFQFVHSGAGSDSLIRRLPPRTEVRVTAFASHDLVVAVSSIRRDVYEMLTAYEVANRIGASVAPFAATGIVGAHCRSAFVVRRVAHLTDADVEPFADNDVVRPELNRVHTLQRQQYAQQGYTTVADPVLFFPEDPLDVVPVDTEFFARDPRPRPRPVHGGFACTSRRGTTRAPAAPVVARLVEVRPAWLTGELAAAAIHLRRFVALMQDKGSAATTVRLGDPVRPGGGGVALPIYVPMTGEAEVELAARLQRVVRFGETAQVRLRRRCGSCRRSSATAPSCRTTRSAAHPPAHATLPVVGRSADLAAGPTAGSARGRVWSCGRCPSARVEEDRVFVCPPCGGLVSQVDAMECCPHCGHVPE